MSAVAGTAPPVRRGYHAYGSTLVAIGLSLLLIALGYGVKLYAEGRTLEVSGAGVTALAPAGWLADRTERELLVRPGGDVGTLYAASLVESDGSELADFAAETTLERAGLLLGFQVLSQSAIRLDGRDGHQIRYVYVSHLGQAGIPELIEGVDVYLPSGASILALSYEAPRDRFDDAYAGFERWAASARGSGQ